MDMKSYFQATEGTGIISTADGDGKVNSAIFSRPHVYDDGNVAFLMLERLTHHNLQSNPFASYLFIERAEGYRGLRLHLKKIREEDDSPLIAKMTVGKSTPEQDRARGPKHLVTFEVVTILPLVGNCSIPVDRS